MRRQSHEASFKFPTLSDADLHTTGISVPASVRLLYIKMKTDFDLIGDAPYKYPSLNSESQATQSLRNMSDGSTISVFHTEASSISRSTTTTLLLVVLESFAFGPSLAHQ